MFVFYAVFLFSFQYINRAYERLSGYATDEILGKNAKEFPRSEKVKPEHMDIINNHLVKDKVSLIWSLCF